MKTVKYLLASLAILSAFAFTTPSEDSYKADASKTSLVWKAKKVTGAHNGKIKLSEGTLSVAKNKLVGGNFTIDMTSIICDDITDAGINAKLIGHLKSDDFFSVEKHKTATFEITSAKHEKGNQYQLTGKLTIKGITNEITFPATVEINKKEATAKATITVNRAKFDVRYGSGSFFDGLGDKMIYDDFDIELNLVATK